jgi:hypothetical protein
MTSFAVLGFLRASDVMGEAWGSWVDWGIVVSLLLCVAIVVLIAAMRLRGRQPLTAPGALVVAILALGAFPVMLLPIGNFTAVEFAKQEHFCASCHGAMQPYVDDMRKPHGASLAALHFQDAFTPTQPGTECYSCHANYGVHGTLTAKLEGLHDAYRYLTGTWHPPISFGGQFPNELCLKCHLPSKIFRAVQLHKDPKGDIMAPILSGAVSCTMCHPSGHLVGGS